MLAHLNTHSYYSLLAAIPSPAELVQAAVKAEMPALALTDRNSLAGMVEFAVACRKAGIQPIHGIEIDLDFAGRGYPLALLAETLAGWRSLCRLASRLNLLCENECPCPLDLLAGCSEGLLAVCLPAGAAVPERLGLLGELFAGRLYAAVQDPLRDRPVLESARTLGLPVVAAPPVFFLTPDQAPLQKVATAIRLGVPLSALPPEAAAPRNAYFPGTGEMQARFHSLPGALQATLEIAARCKAVLPLGETLFPQVPLQPGLSAAGLLRQKAERGAEQHYGRITPQIRERLDHELEVIAAKGFEPIFLIVEEILDFARRSGVPTSSRGSAASSLVAHCLGITTPDPLAYDLYFERFLNPERSSPPDIDTDLCSRRRDQVLAHVFEVYGAERVAMVGTVNRLRPRSALGEVAKAHGLSPESARALTAGLPFGFFARQEENGDTPALAPFAELRAANPGMRAIFDEAEALLRMPRHFSVHAGGLIVGPGRLEDLAPLMRSGSKGITITQMDLESVEALGLVKIDLLGIRGLTVLGDVAEAIYSWRRKEYQGPLDALEAIPHEDVETSDRIEKGETIGCFQIESPGMRATLREIRARTIEDVIAALALYRPGPLQGGLKDAFVRRFKGEEPIAHLHPALAPLLESTYGVILYQEQVLRIAHELAGLSLADADLLRRAMSHFDPGREMQRLKDRFVAGAGEQKGVPRETAERVWEMMAAFAGYGFPKAHAASYALVAWRAAWCKTHFPAEFMAAVLANWGGYYGQRVYLTETRRLGLKTLPPHVNHSHREFCTAYPNGEPVLYMGLDQVRDLTRRTIERILHERPFTSLEDFLARVDPRRQEAANLARVGALEGMGSIPTLLHRLESGGWRAGQMSLFELDLDRETDWDLAQKAAAQQELLGISLSIHPLELFAAAIQRAGALTTVEAAGQIGRRVTVAGIHQSSHRSRTAKGDVMMFLTLEDLEGMIDVVIFPDLYRRVRAVMSGGAPLLITGTVELDEARGEPLLRAERVAGLQDQSLGLTG